MVGDKTASNTHSRASFCRVVVGGQRIPTRAYYNINTLTHSQILRLKCIHTHARARTLARAKTNSCHAIWPPPQAPGFSTPLELEPVRNNVTHYNSPRRTAAAAAFLSSTPKVGARFHAHRSRTTNRLATPTARTAVVIKSNNNKKPVSSWLHSRSKYRIQTTALMVLLLHHNVIHLLFVFSLHHLLLRRSFTKPDSKKSPYFTIQV